MLYRTSYMYLRIVLHGYLKLCVYFLYEEHTAIVATRVFYYPPPGYFTPPPLKKIFLSCRPTTILALQNGPSLLCLPRKPQPHVAIYTAVYGLV